MGTLITSMITLLVAVVSILAVYRFVFLRDPVRTVPPGDVMVSPADGDVVAILDISKKSSITIPKGRFGKVKTLCKDVPKARYLILIVMSVWHVHVQRAPIQAKVTKVKHKDGKFLNAVVDANTFPTVENEMTEMVFSSSKMSAKTIQIAGVLARRIQTFVKKGENVLKGQRIGKITLGSQVALIVPDNVTLFVKEGDAVRAGETVVAKW